MKMLIYLLVGGSLATKMYLITYYCLTYENVTNSKTVIEKQIVITSDSQLYYYTYDNEIIE